MDRYQKAGQHISLTGFHGKVDFSIQSDSSVNQNHSRKKEEEKKRQKQTNKKSYIYITLLKYLYLSLFWSIMI